jgi:hypothetical protein
MKYINEMPEIVGKDKKAIIKEAQENIQRSMHQHSGKSQEEIIGKIQKQ